MFSLDPAISKEADAELSTAIEETLREVAPRGDERATSSGSEILIPHAGIIRNVTKQNLPHSRKNLIRSSREAVHPDAGVVLYAREN